ncbi:MAG: von Willebrand factor type domain [Verrucomicrobiota bacterium]|jgi:hypothetical protein
MQMKKYFIGCCRILLLAICSLALLPVAKAQTFSGRPAPNRFLLVVDTSFSMKSRVKGVQTAVRSILQSGMGAQLQPGDTIGVWTFNSTLFAGKFPLQRWTPPESDAIFARVLEFLSKQPTEKPTDLDAALAGILKVVQDSERITVVLISDADDLLKGTPFDSQINSFYLQNYRQQKKTRMPFVTIFRGEKGKIADYRVSLPPWPPEFPPVPKIAAKEIKLPPVVKKPVVLPVVVPPLIVHGKKTEPPPLQPAPEPSVEKTPSSSAPVEMPKSESVIQPAALPPAAAPVILAPESKPEPVVESKVQQEPFPQVAPVVTETLTTPSGATRPSQPNQPEPAAKVEVAPDVPKPVAISAMPAPVETSSAAKVENVTEKKTVSPAPATTVVAAPSSNAPLPVQTALVTPENSSSYRRLWIIASLVCGFAVLIILLLRRSRMPHSSLITRSLDHDKKP